MPSFRTTFLKFVCSALALLILSFPSPGHAQTGSSPGLGIGGLSENATWQRYFAGRFGPGQDSTGERIVALHAFYGLTLAYSRANWDSGDACRYSGDSSGEITTDFGNGSRSGPLTVYFDPDHSGTLRGVVEARLDVRTWVRDGARIVDADGCAGPKVAVLRENLWRYLVGRDPMTPSEIAALPQARSAPGPIDERPFTPMVANWMPFVDACLQFHKRLGKVSDHITLSCVCTEHVTQETGNIALYQQMTSGYAEARSRGMPPLWVERYNALCGDDAAKKSDRIRDNFALLAPGSPLLLAAMARPALEGDWKSAVLDCVDNLGTFYLDNGYTFSGISIGATCVCTEAAAAQVGDRDLYDSLLRADFDTAKQSASYTAFMQKRPELCDLVPDQARMLNDTVRDRFAEIVEARGLTDEAPFRP